MGQPAVIGMGAALEFHPAAVFAVYEALGHVRHHGLEYHLMLIVGHVAAAIAVVPEQNRQILEGLTVQGCLIVLCCNQCTGVVAEVRQDIIALK